MAFINEKAININDLSLLGIGGLTSAAGIKITDQKALQDSTFMACVRVLSQSIGQLPLEVFRKVGEKNVKVTNEQKALTTVPNDRQTMQEMLELVMTHSCLDGNFYARVEKTRNGEITAIKPFNTPHSVSKVQETVGYGMKYLITFPDGTSEEVPRDKMLHIRGLAYNTYEGIDMLQIAKNALGLSIGATETASAFFKEGCNPGGFLETDDSLSEEAQQRLIKQFSNRNAGASNAYRINVLEKGMKYKANTISLKESQVVEMRNFSITEICRIMGVPPQMIGHNSGIVYNSVEEMNRFFYNSTLSSWLTKIENNVNLHLPDGYFVKFDIKKIINTDQKTNSEITERMFKTHLLTINEGRIRMGLEPIEGGDIMAIGTNNTILGNLGDLEKLQAAQQDRISGNNNTGGSDVGDNETESDTTTD